VPEVEIVNANRENGVLVQGDCPDSIPVAIDIRQHDLKRQTCVKDKINHWLRKWL
jgi:hypothetical protein